MDNLTEHFTYDELTRTSRSHLQAENREQGQAHRAAMVLVCMELEKLRRFLFRPILISSGYRCTELNKDVGGSPHSQHQVGGAADFVVRDFEDYNALEFLFYWLHYHTNYGQLVLEHPPGRSPWIHYGISRPGRERTRYVYDGTAYRLV